MGMIRCTILALYVARPCLLDVAVEQDHASPAMHRYSLVHKAMSSGPQGFLWIKKFGIMGMANYTSTASPLSNFWICGETHRPNDRSRGHIWPVGQRLSTTKLDHTAVALLISYIKTRLPTSEVKEASYF